MGIIVFIKQEQIYPNSLYLFELHLFFSLFLQFYTYNVNGVTNTHSLLSVEVDICIFP